MRKPYVYPNNQVIAVYNKIEPSERLDYNLIIDAIYQADPEKSDTHKGEVLSKLFHVGNQGGFRYIGPSMNPKFIILYTSGEDVYWQDELDKETGLFIYYGDNKKGGKSLHDTKLKGNEILKNIFSLASSKSLEERLKIPPIFIFRKALGRDVKFLGLAVPGSVNLPEKNWLTALWAQNAHGDRYQNYRAYFTVLDNSSGSNISKSPDINLSWLTDILEGSAYSSKYAPKQWIDYIKTGRIKALVAPKVKVYLKKDQQLPTEPSDKFNSLKYLQKFFIDKDRGYSFEKFAVDMIFKMDSQVTEIYQTRNVRDGGFDGYGKYRIFKDASTTLDFDFYLEAKCYEPSKSVGVKETSRLISRIKNRQFGILFTTSYLADQAYQEIVEDSHPITIITGKNIIDFLYDLGFNSFDKISSFINTSYS